MHQLENYIGGTSVAPRSARYADIIDPSTDPPRVLTGRQAPMIVPAIPPPRPTGGTS